MKEKLNDEQLWQTAQYFFKRLEIPVSSNFLKDLLLSHPEHFSLAALSDACKELQVEHVALESVTLEQLKENGQPVVTHLIEKGGVFVVVEDIDDNYIQYYHPERKKVKETIDEFANKWSRVVFYAVPDAASGEQNYSLNNWKEQLFKLRFPFLILSIIGLIAFSIYEIKPELSIPFCFLIFLKFIGLLFIINLIAHELGSSTVISDKVCQAGKQTSCDDVLNSSASKLFGLFHMSDIGLVYFSSTLLVLFSSIVFGNMQPVTTITLYLAACSIPYCCFSLFYQKFRIKKWCPLCLSVISTLLVEAILLFVYWKELAGSIFDFSAITLLILCFVFSTSAWSFLKPLIAKSIEADQFKYKYFRLKKNPQIYNAQLTNNPSLEMAYSSSDPYIGDPNAELTITSVVNTFCSPCAKAHLAFEKIVAENKGKVKLTIRFLVTEEKEALHLIQLFLLKGVDTFQKALNVWFETKNIKILEEEYPVGDINQETINTLQAHRQWCDNLQIDKTPTIFINQKKVGLEYTVEDIQWLIHNTLNS